MAHNLVPSHLFDWQLSVLNGLHKHTHGRQLNLCLVTQKERFDLHFLLDTADQDKLS